MPARRWFVCPFKMERSEMKSALVVAHNFIEIQTVVGEHLVNCLASFNGLKASEDANAIIRSCSGLVENCLKQDMDGVTVLSYLDPILRKSYFEDKDSLHYVLKSACRNIQRRSSLSRKENGRLNGRLTKVEEYFRREGCWIENR
ncbi:MAG: hypothetical protein A4E65_01237 [Syntrophorhabdus sp. PtaU1.Bin153]|nr:MAG: hypothetical protein A4E65_01237 [Syntrophorhabdus sp. PtaU1.Bin153]